MSTYAAKDGKAQASENSHATRPRAAIRHGRAADRDTPSSALRALDHAPVSLCAHPIAVQAKLSVGAPGDAHEQEADRIAAQIVNMSDNPVGARASQSGTATPGLLRAKHQAAPAAAPVAVPRIVHDVLGSPGQPLDAATRGFMEPRFGRDFGDVRVHTGARAEQSATAIHADAYASGPHIVFGPDKFAPRSQAGRTLLAHELAHVVQQEASATIRRQVAKDSLDPQTGGTRIPDASNFNPGYLLNFPDYGIGKLDNQTDHIFIVVGSIGKNGKKLFHGAAGRGKWGGDNLVTGLGDDKNIQFNDIDFIYATPTTPLNGVTTGVFKLAGNEARIYNASKDDSKLYKDGKGARIFNFQEYGPSVASFQPKPEKK